MEGCANLLVAKKETEVQPPHISTCTRDRSSVFEPLQLPASGLALASMHSPKQSCLQQDSQLCLMHSGFRDAGDDRCADSREPFRA